jgi:hypothetical protein
LEVVSTRFGFFQWAGDGNGLYILDGSANTVGNYAAYIIASRVHYADLYYIDLTQETHPEQKIAADIPLYRSYFGAWAYSPQAQAMTGTFAPSNTFGILFLEAD